MNKPVGARAEQVLNRTMEEKDHNLKRKWENV